MIPPLVVGAENCRTMTQKYENEVITRSRIINQPMYASDDVSAGGAL
jgi:hypothetical protein